MEHRGARGAHGEMAERLKARAWKVRVPQKGTVGSNPTLSATQSAVAETLPPLPATIPETPALSRGLGRGALDFHVIDFDGLFGQRTEAG